jgi:pyrroloquinoline quinone (PQQ) biosynthesis protein C
MISEINRKVGAYRQTLLQHPLYNEIKAPAHLQLFMEHHVFAVWDFMSLLKTLQNTLTCTTTPWVPVGDPETRYLINEIVLAEETDINRYGKRQSHFEMYLDAMHQAKANLAPVEGFLQMATTTDSIFEAIEKGELAPSVKAFLTFTFQVIADGAPHKIAAAFTFGREDLIPAMFSEIIQKIQQNFPEEDLTDFKYYFDRHIELDGDEHGPMALKMVEHLCGTDLKKWREAEQTVIAALQVREQLWDGILNEIMTSEIAVK